MSGNALFKERAYQSSSIKTNLPDVLISFWCRHLTPAPKRHRNAENQVIRQVLARLGALMVERSGLDSYCTGRQISYGDDDDGDNKYKTTKTQYYSPP
jgi:hypothetical protein